MHPLKGSICTKESSKDIYAVNEIVIKSVCSRTLHLDLRANENKIQNFSGDGMLYQHLLDLLHTITQQVEVL